MVYVGIIGHGTVGSGVAEVLIKNKCGISKRAGDEIQIKRILDIRDFDELEYSYMFTKHSDDLLEDDEISIVIEVMGGLEPAYSFTKQALMSGKNVVTSNKELVAQHGPELLKLAKENNVSYLFEASVGGGIPIIMPLKQCLAANEISELTGILNGTTNFILTEMKDKGSSFDETLKDAQNRGYAEKDPTADIEGHDAQRKIAILASIAFEGLINYKDITTQGITNVKKEDILFAQELGHTIKLLAEAKRTETGIAASVSPVMLNDDNPLADVNGVFNAIMVYGDAIGDVMFYGQGAGKLPTASAVVGDVIDIVKHIGSNNNKNDQYTERLKVIDEIDNKSIFYIRFVKIDHNCDTNIMETLGDIIESKNEVLKGQFALITKPMTNSELDENLNKNSDSISVLNKIRVR